MSTGARRNTLLLLAAPALICAMLTAALALMDANRAPWWAQTATGLAVLVSAVVLGVQINQATGGRGQATGGPATSGRRSVPRWPAPGGQDWDGYLNRQGRTVTQEQVYWTERAPDLTREAWGGEAVRETDVSGEKEEEQA